jgi:hypothetical protein
MTLDRYRNTITGIPQTEKPPEFAGGILADQMGLGKTLSVLALIAANPAKHLLESNRGNDCTRPRVANSTLIIVPYSCELRCPIRTKVATYLMGTLNSTPNLGRPDFQVNPYPLLA